MEEAQGKVTIAPSVLTTIVRLTALEQRGVHRLAPIPPNVRSLLTGGTTEDGISIKLTDEGVQVKLHVVAEADANMLELGQALQAKITRAITEMVGLPVTWVDVHIDDVILPTAKAA